MNVKPCRPARALWAKIPFLVTCILLAFGNLTGQEERPQYLSIGKQGGSAVYFYDGQPILSNEEFKSIVFALNDRETTKLLERSQILHMLAYPFSLLGTGLTGWALYKFYSKQGQEELDYTSLSIGAGVTVFGLVIGYKSKGLKLRCISRFNMVVKQRWEKSLKARMQNQVPAVP